MQPSPCFPFAGDSIFFFSCDENLGTATPAQARASSARPQQDPSSSGAVVRPYLHRPDDSRSASRHIHCRSSRAKYRRSNYLPRQRALPSPHSPQLRQLARVLRPQMLPILTVPDPWYFPRGCELGAATRECVAHMRTRAPCISQSPPDLEDLCVKNGMRVCPRFSASTPWFSDGEWSLECT